MYVSPIDILEISLEELANLDEKGLIRLEKKLKIRKLQKGDNAYNPQQFDHLLEQLSDEFKKNSILFVEQHTNLKKFLSTGKDQGPKTFAINERLLTEVPHIKEFLSPYFEAYFMGMVKKHYKSNTYDTILQAMKYKALFTDKLLTEYYRYITDQTAVVVERIKVTQQGQLIKKCPQITYRSFVELLNTVPLGFIQKTKLAYVNTMVDYYNATLNRYREFAKVKRVFGNFIHITVNNPELTEYLKKLSRQIVRTPLRDHAQEKESSSSNAAWRAVALLVGVAIFIIRIIGFSSNSSSSSNSLYYNAPNQIDYTRYGTTYDKDKTEFYSDLIQKASDSTNLSGPGISLVNGTNPYPGRFMGINSYGRNRTDLKNNRESHLIVFVKNNYSNAHKAVLVRSGDSISIGNLDKNSTLVFYSGKEFYRSNRKSPFGVEEKTLRSMLMAKRYFREVSEVEKEWLKNKYRIDSVGSDPKIFLEGNKLRFDNIFVNIEKNEILPEEEEEVIPDF